MSQQSNANPRKGVIIPRPTEHLREVYLFGIACEVADAIRRLYEFWLS